MDSANVPCQSSEHHADEPELSKLIPVNGGRDDNIIVLEVFPPPPEKIEGEAINQYFEAGDQIEITLPWFDLSGVVASRLENNSKLLSISDSGDAQVVGSSPEGLPSVEVNSATQKLILTLGANAVRLARDPHEHLVITIGKGTGILAPRIPSGFDEEGDPYRVQITFLDKRDYAEPPEPLGPPHPADDENLIVVRNPVSSTVPGAEVRVELHTFSEGEIHSHEEIVVDFSGLSDDDSFTVPETIDEKDAAIVHGSSRHTPSSVLVRGRRVVLTVPTEEDDLVTIKGNFSIIFSQSAGIENPFAAGERIIVVSSYAHVEDEDEITAVIRRTTTVNPAEGGRGSKFTLEGKGYADGTVTVFDGEDDSIDAGELLGSVNTSRGAFELDLTARGSPGESGYRVRTLDSNGTLHDVVFQIESSLSFDPDPVRAGAGLKITVSDWNDSHRGVAAVSVGGKTAFAAEPTEYGECFEFDAGQLPGPGPDGAVSLEVAVPPGVPPGLQTVSVFVPEDVRLTGVDGKPVPKRHCAGLGDMYKGSRVRDGDRRVEISDTHNPIASSTITVEGRTLDVFPESAARGARITIIGSGIRRVSGGGRDILEVAIGGWVVAEDPSRFEVPHDGQFALTVTVPVDAADGANEVRVEGEDGTLIYGTVTVPEPALTVMPEEGRRGSTVSVKGSGFVASGLVSLFYGDGEDLSSGDEHVDAVLADRKGSFTASITVPVDARLGTRHTVTALARTGGRDGAPVRAGASHSVPPGTLSAVQDTACPGDTLTILGENLPPFAMVRSVRVGGVDVTPSPNPATDEDGSFWAEVTVPHLEPGNQSVSARVLNTVLVDVVEIVDTPLTGPPALVFKDLIRAGSLERVWHFESSTQTWSFFDPDPMFAGFNNLNEVGTGDILWVHLSRDHHFQGEDLGDGWHLIRLE